jgi:hypothetical protein
LKPIQRYFDILADHSVISFNAIMQKRIEIRRANY